MTIPEAEAYRTAIIRTAVDWAHGEHTIDQLELCVLGDYYDVDLPLYIRHFRYSNGLEHVSAAQAYKGILRTLKKLQTAILKKEAQA
nr:hypothetical protein [uncultured Oscillibacter sp.]